MARTEKQRRVAEMKSRHLLDAAINEFRRLRVVLIREGHDKLAADLTSRAAAFLNDLTQSAEAVLTPPVRTLTMRLKARDDRGEE